MSTHKVTCLRARILKAEIDRNGITGADSIYTGDGVTANCSAGKVFENYVHERRPLQPEIFMAANGAE
jgi:hypothetical protein